MNSDDRNAIDDLAARIARFPAAPYYMAQAVIVQQQALEEAHARLQDLERQLEERSSGGFLGALFGGGAAGQPARSSGYGSAPRGYGAQRGYSAMGGQRGGFLAGAAQTAMGVAGGVVLGSMIAGMLTPDAAQAAEPPAEDDAGGDLGDAGGDDFSF
jgi:hypothetical protein